MCIITATPEQVREKRENEKYKRKTKSYLISPYRDFT